jgi:glutathione S-transferase
MMLKIYGVFRSRASRVFWIAHELGIPYEHVPVIQAPRLADPATPDAPLNTASAAYLAINPNGKIPCIDDDGLVMHESLAITLYLAKKHGGPLAPRHLEEEGLMTMWALWAATACEPHTVQIIFHRVDYPESKRDEAVVQAAISALRSPLQVLDENLKKGGGFLVGRRFTVADLNTAEVFRYAQPAPELLRHYKHVLAWLATCQARPAYNKMMALRSAEQE